MDTTQKTDAPADSTDAVSPIFEPEKPADVSIHEAYLASTDYTISNYVI